MGTDLQQKEPSKETASHKDTTATQAATGWSRIMTFGIQHSDGVGFAFVALLAWAKAFCKDSMTYCRQTLYSLERIPNMYRILSKQFCGTCASSYAGALPTGTGTTFRAFLPSTCARQRRLTTFVGAVHHLPT